MPFVKSNQTIEQLSVFDEFFKNSSIQCWKMDSGKLTIYLFAIIYESLQELQAEYKTLRDHVAISFQGNTLVDAAERWNIYLLYLVKEEIPEEVKQVIVQDKFSARKIVVSTGGQEVTDELINEKVVNVFFTIDIPQRIPREEYLAEIIHVKHPEVAVLLEQFDVMKTRENLDDLIKILNP